MCKTEWEEVYVDKSVCVYVFLRVAALGYLSPLSAKRQPNQQRGTPVTGVPKVKR